MARGTQSTEKGQCVGFEGILVLQRSVATESQACDRAAKTCAERRS